MVSHLLAVCHDVVKFDSIYVPMHRTVVRFQVYFASCIPLYYIFHIILYLDKLAFEAFESTKLTLSSLSSREL